MVFELAPLGATNTERGRLSLSPYLSVTYIVSHIHQGNPDLSVQWLFGYGPHPIVSNGLIE
jgi:hypothetical protein